MRKRYILVIVLSVTFLAGILIWNYKKEYVKVSDADFGQEELQIDRNKHKTEEIISVFEEMNENQKMLDQELEKIEQEHNTIDENQKMLNRELEGIGQR